jgi:hypothetical protein
MMRYTIGQYKNRDALSNKTRRRITFLNLLPDLFEFDSGYVEEGFSVPEDELRELIAMGIRCPQSFMRAQRKQSRTARRTMLPVSIYVFEPMYTCTQRHVLHFVAEKQIDATLHEIDELVFHLLRERMLVHRRHEVDLMHWFVELEDLMRVVDREFQKSQISKELRDRYLQMLHLEQAHIFAMFMHEAIIAPQAFGMDLDWELKQLEAEKSVDGVHAARRERIKETVYNRVISEMAI